MEKKIKINLFKKIKNRIISNIFMFFEFIGLKVVSKWRWEKHELEYNLKNLFKLLDIDCVIDVGANKGQFGKFLRNNIGYKGDIISFEPVLETFYTLSDQSKADPFWRVYRFALGERMGNKEINITKESQLNSFLDPIETGINFVDELNTTKRKEIVPIITLDYFFNENKNLLNNKKIFLKLDTQGYDLEVLEGGTLSIPRILGLQTEISCIPIYSNMLSFTKSIENLKEKGFDVTGMFPVNQDKYYRVIEFDCVCINTKEIESMVVNK